MTSNITIFSTKTGMIYIKKEKIRLYKYSTDMIGYAMRSYLVYPFLSVYVSKGRNLPCTGQISAG